MFSFFAVVLFPFYNQSLLLTEGSFFSFSESFTASSIPLPGCKMCWNMFWREVKIKKSDLFVTTTQSEKCQGCKKKIRLSEALGEGKSEAAVPRTKVRWQHRVRSLSPDSTVWSWHATGWVSVKWVTFCLGLHVRGSSRQAFGSILFKNLFGFGALAGIFVVVATTPTWSYHFIWSKYLVQRFGHSSHSSVAQVFHSCLSLWFPHCHKPNGLLQF